MRASTTSTARTAWLSLLTAALTLIVWGTTLLSVPHSSSVLSQRPHLNALIADGGGTKPTG
jgi:hypothetical protein